MNSLIFAQEAANTASMFGSPVLMIALFFGAFYFFAIRPNNKRKKDQQNMSTNLKAGDEVLTIGGFKAYVVDNDPDADDVTIELSEGVKVRLVKNAIARKILPPLPEDWEPEDVEELRDNLEEDETDVEEKDK